MTPDTHCPLCEKTQIVHSWRVDMDLLRWVDSYSCLACGNRWQVIDVPIEMREPL